MYEKYSNKCYHILPTYFLESVFVNFCPFLYLYIKKTLWEAGDFYFVKTEGFHLQYLPLQMNYNIIRYKSIKL